MVNGLSMLMLAKNSVLPRICRTYSPCYAIPRAPSSLSRMREVACRGVSSVAGVALKLDSGISHPRPHSEIPGPMAWPILGTMPSMFTDPGENVSDIRFFPVIIEMHGNITFILHYKTIVLARIFSINVYDFCVYSI